MTSTPIQPTSVSGVQLAQGIAVAEAKGFWAETWAQVLKRPAALVAIGWLSVIAFFAVFAPIIANGHPLILRQLDSDGAVVGTSSPLLTHLRASDVVLLLGSPAALLWIMLSSRSQRAPKLGASIFGAILATLIIVLTALVRIKVGERDPTGLFRLLRDWEMVVPGPIGTIKVAAVVVPATIGLVLGAIGMLIPAISSFRRRACVVLAAAALAWLGAATSWDRPLQVFDYIQRERAGEITAVYTIVPFSSNQRFSELDRRPPGSTLEETLGFEPGTPAAGRRFYMGTDALGQDVLSQILSAARLAISIGLVSTGIAVVIGVTMGSLMGYFGGWVDLCLYRVVEVFQAVPVLFLLIITAAVTPPELRSTYTMMAIIGCFTWTTSARFIRAEFFKLRGQDFVQSAKAVGLPLRSVLFKHMLPNGVTPVLVDASFLIAAAITIEATLSFLGLGPVDQPSWGKLLANATNTEGLFKWWLAIFPGGTIFLTVLAYNLIGEALRDAIDPKLKKARV